MFADMAVGQIRKGLDSHESEEPLALDYLQRLNLAGLDTKGQLSLAHGQAGVGVAVSAGIDFGAMFVPFLHLEVGASLGVGATADGLLLIQRMPSRLWAADIVQPQQAPAAQRDAPLPPTFTLPNWSSRTPLALAFLRGKTFRFQAGAFAKAWAGIGTFDDQDETGATLGAKIEGDAGATFTRLIDPAASHHPAEPAGATLRHAVDDLFVANLKAKASAWLLGTAGGVKDLQEFGTPDRTRTAQVVATKPRLTAATARLKAAGTKVAKGAVLLAKSYDELTIPDVDTFAATGVGASTLRALRAAGRRVRDALRAKTLKTDDLLAELAAVQKALDPWIDWLSGPAVRKGHDADGCRRLADLARRRKAEALRLSDALTRRAAAKLTPQVAAAAPAGAPAFSLDITALEAHGGVTASAKLVLPRDKLKLQIAAGADAKLRRNLFRYQSWVPGPPGRLLRCTQDTVVTYVSRQVFAEGAAQSQAFSKKRSNLVTMSYRSVLAQWFDNKMQEAGKALPNGSGVSFGMSVLPKSLSAYVRCCKYLKDDPSHPEATMDEGLKNLEAALTKQLRVQADELRRFMRNAPSGLGAMVIDAADGTTIASYLIEAAFAVTAPVPLVFDPKKQGTTRSPEDLFELPEVAALIQTGQRGTALRLQVIRLRYRIQTGRDQDVGVLELGWNPEPWGEDSGDEVADDAESWFEKLTGFDPTLPDWLKLSALAVEIGVEINAVRRVGCEGVFDLYTHFVPNPYSHEPPPAGYGRDLALQHESSRRGELAEMLVPPVALFRQ